jgi:hypothetical protein
MDRNEREWENLGREEESESSAKGCRPATTGVSSEIDRHRVIAYLDGILASLRALRGDPKFWLGLGPAFRVRYEDFEGDLAMQRAAFRES